MARTHTLLQVFVASPSDVPDERTLVDDVISEFNKTWGHRNGVMLELLKWETDCHPGFGADSQQVINTQIGDEYDIFIGVMWGRFGSPTKRAESGTEEEFNRAYNRLSDAPHSVQIMFYFKDAGIPPSKIDPDQLQKVQEFKRKISNEYGGLYHTFETPEQFQSSVRIHLSTLVQEWLDANASGNTSVPARGSISDDVPPDDNNPLANLLALKTETDEEGVIELVESANESMTMVTTIVQRMSDATNALGDRFTQLTEEANQVTKGDMKSVKRVSNKAADDLEAFVTRMSVEIVDFNKYSTRAMDTIGNIAMMAEKDLHDDPDDIAKARKHIHGYTDAITSSAESLSEFRGIIFKLPRMTTAFNRARKRAVAVMDDLLNQLRIAASQSEDVERLLTRIESTDDESQ